MEQELDPGLPVTVTGDFNVAAQAGKAVFDLLVTNGPLLDTWAEAKERGRLYATMHRYQPPVLDGRRIDWILTSPDVTTRAARVNTFQHRGRFPSDHHAVQAVFRLPAGSPAVAADRS